MPEKHQPPATNRQSWSGPEVREKRELPGALEQSRRLEALARLSGEVAHDVNNALQVIQNAVEILRRRLPSAEPEVTGLVDMLARNSNRASGLMLSLLAFSGRLPLEPRALDANYVIAGIAIQLREAAGVGVITVETALGDGLWRISADAERLRAAMLSLTTNGREAMPRGGTLTIETRNVCIDSSTHNPVPPGDYVSITVRDDGTGMTPEVIAEVFDPYFTTKETGYGTGLGLSQVYGFMKQSNGYININSSPGSGTSVTLLFPRLAVANEMETPNVSRPLSETATRTHTAGSFAGLRVLLVEDESLIGTLVDDLLRQLGCHIIGPVSNVEKALELAGSAELDVALLDADLGGEGVYPVARALQIRGVPFVFMNGHRGLDRSWNNRPIIQKPFDLGQLRGTMGLALGRAS